MPRVLRFLRSFVGHSVPHVDDRRVTLIVDDAEVPASYIRPPGRCPLPGWIVLHGITVPGREHPALKRFAYALASTGAAVLIPEVPAWRRLELDPSVGDATIEAAANHLTSSDEVAGSNLNLVGFSFGATQALMSATRPKIARSVRAIVAFGGYCDLGRTVHFMTTGEHEWKGDCRRIEPDPYGRWIVVGNYLTDVPQFAHMRELQEAARELAMEAGRLGTYAADPVYDPVKSRLRSRLPREQQEIWDVFAPPYGIQAPLEESRALAVKLFEATLRRHPGLDPKAVLRGVDQKVVLIHGHDDRLIPFTETLRLRSHLPPEAAVTSYVTWLFAHSREAERLGALEYPRELARICGTPKVVRRISTWRASSGCSGAGSEGPAPKPAHPVRNASVATATSTARSTEQDVGASFCRPRFKWAITDAMPRSRSSGSELGQESSGSVAALDCRSLSMYFSKK
ncbi:MAG: hypothetical protein GEU90_17910 [Gemmatimonas sp.]|nr:hypothetical protein [Gemmatimonas sp.]